jgi:hypothetical protein
MLQKPNWWAEPPMVLIALMKKPVKWRQTPDAPLAR